MRRQLLQCVHGLCLLSLCLWGTAQQSSEGQIKSASELLGYPVGTRLLVIQAEDLGMAHSIDEASFEALEKGWVAK